MTLFEYLAIAFSLVLSSAAMRLIGGLPHALNRTRRDWTYLGFLVILLLSIAVTFWGYWSYRDATWTLPKFMFALSHLGSIYFLAVTLVPENPREIASWRDYYYSVRVRLFSGLAILALLVAINASLLVDMPLNHPVRLNQLFMLLVGIVGASTDDARVHGSMIALALVLTLISILTTFARASSLV